MFGNQALEMLNSRLDNVEQHVAKCAQKHELDEVKKCLEKTNDALVENGNCIHSVQSELAKIQAKAEERDKMGAKRIAWLGIGIAIAVPFIEEVKDVLFHKPETNPAHHQQHNSQTDTLLRELIQLQKQK